MQSRQTLAISLVLLSMGLAMPAHAQAWPQKPVVIIVPFAAGGNTDGIARITAQRLGDAFGQQFVDRMNDFARASGILKGAVAYDNVVATQFSHLWKE